MSGVIVTHEDELARRVREGDQAREQLIAALDERLAAALREARELREKLNALRGISTGGTPKRLHPETAARYGGRRRHVVEALRKAGAEGLTVPAYAGEAGISMLAAAAALSRAVADGYAVRPAMGHYRSAP